MVAGSAYWESDRSKRKQFDELSEEKRKKEKRDAWIKELEIRDAEETELRRLRENMFRGRKAESQGLTEQQARAAEAKGEGKGGVRSALESCEGRADGPVLAAVRALWDR
jgi:hypothetical protein